MILVAHVAYEIGTELAAKKNGVGDGIGWLEWAKGILKDQTGNSARALEVTQTVSNSCVKLVDAIRMCSWRS